MDPKLLQSVYDAIGEYTPLNSDCGTLCGAACCFTNEDGQGGVTLLPGEEKQLEGQHWARIEHDPYMNAPMLMCQGPCERELRPFLCRVFPLCPVIGKSGKWTVRMDARAAELCPLRASGLSGLAPEFPKAVVRAVRILAEDPEGEAFLRRWAELEAEFRKPLW